MISALETVKKHYEDNRAAGEREGARPASQYNNRQQKACVSRRLPSEARFFVIFAFTKNVAAAACQKGPKGFFDKLRAEIV